MIEDVKIIIKSLLFKIINYHILFLSDKVIPYVLAKEIIKKKF